MVDAVVDWISPITELMVVPTVVRLPPFCEEGFKCDDLCS